MGLIKKHLQVTLEVEDKSTRSEEYGLTTWKGGSALKRPNCCQISLDRPKLLSLALIRPHCCQIGLDRHKLLSDWHWYALIAVRLVWFAQTAARSVLIGPNCCQIGLATPKLHGCYWNIFKKLYAVGFTHTQKSPPPTPVPFNIVNNIKC